MARRRGAGEAYYNEFDPMAAAWLRHLIEEGVIARGVVDTRSIKEVQPDDLRGFAQCHFFAGVGVWSYALRQAGWADDEPIWTGSCPCQPFSAAGRQLGFSDARHLWPDWLRLIQECGPKRIVGEQVASAGAWLDLVSTDLEARRYAFAAVDIPAAGFLGAHIRQRFFWVADANGGKSWDGSIQRGWKHRQLAEDSRPAIRLGDAQRSHDGIEPRGLSQAEGARAGWGCDGSGSSSPTGDLGDTQPTGLSDAKLGIIRRPGWGQEGGAAQQPGDPSRPGVDWLLCRDSRWRPVEPGTCPLVDEAPARMGRLRGYGNALDAEAASQFIGAYMEASDLLEYGDIA